MEAVIPLAANAVTASIYQGEQSRKAQKRAQDAQERAQRQATMMAVAERRRAGDAERKLNQRVPDTMALLAAAQQAGEGGVASTFLSARKRRQGSGDGPATLLGDVGDVAS